MCHRNILFLLVAAAWISSSSQEKLKLTIYGESLCPDTQNFILNQLVPGYKVLADYVDLEFVPYGKAQRTIVNGKTKFTCQHGVRECIGNTIQACALNFATSQEEKFGFMTCTTTPNPENLDLAKKCGEANGISWESLEACINGPLGEKLSNYMGDLTDKVKPDDVPLILVNGTGDDSTSYPIRYNFMSICSYYHEKPSGCP